MLRDSQAEAPVEAVTYLQALAFLRLAQFVGPVGPEALVPGSS